MSKVNADIFLGTIWRFVFLCLNLYMKCSNIVVHSVHERKTKYEGKNIPAGATVHETQNSFYRYFNSKWQKFHLKTDIRWSASLMQRRLHCILWVTILSERILLKVSKFIRHLKSAHIISFSWKYYLRLY